MIVIWDLETTGFVAPEAKILEIGAKIVHEDGTIEDKNWILNNNVEIPEKITAINGFTKEIIEAEGRDPKMCIDEFIPFLIDCKKHITHNGLNFDIPFLVNTVVDILKWNDAQRDDFIELLKSKAFDTAVHFKSAKLLHE